MRVGLHRGYNNGTDFTGILKTFHSLFQQGNAQGHYVCGELGRQWRAVPCVSKSFADTPGYRRHSISCSASRIPRTTRMSPQWAGRICRRAATPGVDDATYLE